MRRISETKAGSSAAKSESSSEAVDEAEELFSDQIVQRVFQSEAVANTFGRFAIVNPDFVKLYRCAALVPSLSLNAAQNCTINPPSRAIEGLIANCYSYAKSMEAREVNRSSMIVIAKQPFLDWLHSVDVHAGAKALTLDDVNREPAVYLVPECESDEEFADWLEGNFKDIFEEQLGGWWKDKRSWPGKRTFDLFQKWFDCRLHSLVLDIADEPLSVIK